MSDSNCEELSPPCPDDMSEDNILSELLEDMSPDEPSPNPARLKVDCVICSSSSLAKSAPPSELLAAAVLLPEVLDAEVG